MLTDSCSLTYSCLLTHSLTHAYSLTHQIKEADKKAKSRSYINSGTFKATNCFIEEHPSLSDYVLGGCEMSLMVAIDFSARYSLMLTHSLMLTYSLIRTYCFF